MNFFQTLLTDSWEFTDLQMKMLVNFRRKLSKKVAFPIWASAFVSMG